MSQKQFDFAATDLVRFMKAYVDPDILESLVFCEQMVLTSKAGSATETHAWSEWKDLNQLQDPSFLVDYMSEEDKASFPRTVLEHWKINAAVQGAANLSLKTYASKPDLSWQAAVEWARLCIEADRANHLEPCDLAEIKNSSQPSYLRDFTNDLMRFCGAEEGILCLVLGQKPQLNSVLGLFH